MADARGGPSSPALREPLGPAQLPTAAWTIPLTLHSLNAAPAACLAPQVICAFSRPRYTGGHPQLLTAVISERLGIGTSLAHNSTKVGTNFGDCLPAMCDVTYLDAIQEETTASMSDAVLSGRTATTTTKMGIKGQGCFVAAQLPPGRRDKWRISLSQSVRT